jgi:glycosyltransferase involved in cell wall biosynthesis
MKNKILILGTSDFGGVTVYVSSLVNRIRDFGFIIPVDDKVNVEKLRFFFPNALLIPSRLNFSYLSLLHNFKELDSIVNSNNIEVIHAHTLRAGSLVALYKFFYKSKVKLIYTGHGLRFTQKTNRLGKFIFRHIEKVTNRLSDKVIYIRKWDYKIALEMKLVTNDKAIYIKTQIEKKNIILEEFDIRSKFKINTKFIIANAGSIYDLKNPRLFIDIANLVLKETKDVTFIWFGDGDTRLSILKELDNKKMSGFIKFVGAVDSDLMPTVFQQVDGLLLTSKIETFPLVILEAYATNTLVFSSNYIGCSELVKDKRTGFVFNMNLAPEAASCILRSLSDETLRSKIIDNAAGLFESTFTNIDLFTKEHNDLYKIILQ